MRLSSYGWCGCFIWWGQYDNSQICDDKDRIKNDSEYRAEMLQMQELDASNYGFYWTVDSTKYWSKTTSKYFLDRFNEGSMEYAYAPTMNNARLSLTEQYNEFTDETDEFYQLQRTKSATYFK